MEADAERLHGHVLVVDDDDDLRVTVCELLDAVSFATTGVANLDDARRALAKGNIDVILLDYNLRGETACPLLEELALAPKAPPAVLFSASVIAKDVAKRYALLSVPKPFDIEELEARLFEAMRNEDLKSAIPTA